MKGFSGGFFSIVFKHVLNQIVKKLNNKTSSIKPNKMAVKNKNGYRPFVINNDNERNINYSIIFTRI